MMTDANRPEDTNEPRETVDETPKDGAASEYASDESFSPLPWDEPGDYMDAPVDDDFPGHPEGYHRDEARLEPEWHEPPLVEDELEGYGSADDYRVSVDEIVSPPRERRVAYDSVSRLHELNLAIELYPDVAMNFLLRAEYFVEQRELHLAKADFETALTLASEQFETDAWGLVNQYVIDRASLGLMELD